MSATSTTSTDVELVRSFVNTLDVDDETDELATPQGLARWLERQGLAGPSAPVSRAELTIAHRLREALRDELFAHHDRTDEAPIDPQLDEVLTRLPVRVVSGAEVVAPTGEGATWGLSAVVAAMARSRLAGTWERLKLCPADDCLWAFYDESRNHSRRWCSMEGCGNRSKVRAFRDRTRS